MRNINTISGTVVYIYIYIYLVLTRCLYNMISDLVTNSIRLPYSSTNTVKIMNTDKFTTIASKAHILIQLRKYSSSACRTFKSIMPYFQEYYGILWHTNVQIKLATTSESIPKALHSGVYTANQSKTVIPDKRHSIC